MIEIHFVPYHPSITVRTNALISVHSSVQSALAAKKTRERTAVAIERVERDNDHGLLAFDEILSLPELFLFLKVERESITRTTISGDNVVITGAFESSLYDQLPLCVKPVALAREKERRQSRQMRSRERARK